MDLASVCNAPRELPLGGTTYRARTLTLGQLGEVLAWLEGRVSTEDGALPRFADPSSQLALSTTEGLAVVLHLSLSGCHPDLSRDSARAVASTMTEADAERLMAIAFRRRPGYAPPEEGEDKDLSEVNWGEMIEGLSGHRADRYEAAAGLTLDQVDNFVHKGEAPEAGTLSLSKVQAMWEEAQANGEGVAHAG